MNGFWAYFVASKVDVVIEDFWVDGFEANN